MRQMLTEREIGIATPGLRLLYSMDRQRFGRYFLSILHHRKIKNGLLCLLGSIVMYKHHVQDVISQQNLRKHAHVECEHSTRLIRRTEKAKFQTP